MGLTDLETIPDTGAVFTIGRSRFADNVASHFFIRKDPVVSIACGDEHSAVICQTGRLFVFGSNNWGQLGLAHKNHISKPSCVKALKPEKVTHVACGRAHTLICTGAQKIFACGSDQEGQLGRGTSAIGDSTSTPVLVYNSGLAGPRIVQIAAGSHHSLALTSDGGVFAWGSNLEGQLGLPDVTGLVNKPTKVHIPEPVKQISAGYYHSTFLTESGLVYVCGESESGKLGIDVNFSTQVAPKQMQLPSPAMHVACGGHHTVVLAENGNLYCTGNNSCGQLGLGTNFVEFHTPKLLPRGAIQSETITRISCGESHTAIVTASGMLFTCGDGRHGKLGLEENENNVHELTFVPRYKDLFVSNVACGGCHTILVGQRRETGKHMQKEMDGTEMEQVQKRSSLPPLKVPVSRLQSEPRDDTFNEIIKDQLNPEKGATESITSVKATMEAASAKIQNNMKNSENSIADIITDSMNNIQKADTPEKSTERSAKDSPEKMLSDTTSSEAKPEAPSKEMPVSTEESRELKTQNDNEEPKNDNEVSEIKVDSENNVQEEKRSESVISERNNEDNNNEAIEEPAKKDAEKVEKISMKSSIVADKDMADNKEANNEDVKQERTKEQMKSADEGNSENKASPKKQMSPTNGTAPPKPPRLKPGSGSSSAERSSSLEKENEEVKMEDEAKKESTVDEKPEAVEEERLEKKEESGSAKSVTKSVGSSKSIRSKSSTHEAVETDKQNDKEKVIEEKMMVEEEKAKNDTAEDDADVVQSPPPRIGKMSKIFRSTREKKAQTLQNGTRTGGTVNHKSKSKTCTIL